MCFVCPSWLSFILYNPVRKLSTDREKVLEESGVTNDSTVLEVGAGNGFFTEVLAERARKVYAVEFQDGMVKKLQRRVARFGDRITMLRCDIAVCGLEESAVDICLLYYSFHEVKKKTEAAKNIARAVKAGGLLSIYEPTVEVSKQQMRKTVELFENDGFQIESERDGIFTRFVRLRKAAL